MPVYCYHCSNCNMKFEKCHNMSQILIDCDYCNSKNSLKRIPSIFGITNKKDNKAERNIEQFIKDAKEDVREMKKELQENIKEKTQ